jgi:ATP-dependent Clp protease ATP-binding subunit ClpB
LPDSAIDLIDEACAAARIAQDMNPEAIDTLDNKKLHVLAYIKALEVSHFSYPTSHTLRPRKAR